MNETRYRTFGLWASIAGGIIVGGIVLDLVHKFLGL